MGNVGPKKSNVYAAFSVRNFEGFSVWAFIKEALRSLWALRGHAMIFTAKYHWIAARDLRSRAERTSHEAERKKLLALAHLHDKLAKHAAKTSSAEDRIRDAVRVQRQGGSSRNRKSGIGEIWVPSPPLQP
jgi:hypothetical protein